MISCSGWENFSAASRKTRQSTSELGVSQSVDSATLIMAGKPRCNRASARCPGSPARYSIQRQDCSGYFVLAEIVTLSCGLRVHGCVALWGSAATSKRRFLLATNVGEVDVIAVNMAM